MYKLNLYVNIKRFFLKRQQRNNALEKSPNGTMCDQEDQQNTKESQRQYQNKNKNRYKHKTKEKGKY